MNNLAQNEKQFVRDTVTCKVSDLRDDFGVRTTIEEASGQFDVTEISLRDWMKRSEPGRGLDPAYSVSRINKSHTAKIEDVLDKALQQFRERKISEKELKRAIGMLQEMAKHWELKYDNYLKRYRHAAKVAKSITRDIPLEMAGTA